MSTSFQWYGDQAKARMHAGTSAGLEKAAHHLKGEAVKQAPIQDGILRGSARTTAFNNGLAQCVSFDTPYAVRQHEGLGFHHPKGGKAKYLEDPFNSERVTMMMMIAAEQRRRLL